MHRLLFASNLIPKPYNKPVKVPGEACIQICNEKSKLIPGTADSILLIHVYIFMKN
jgi:hypothetical protein